VLGARAPRMITSLHGTDVTRVGVDPAYRAVTRLCVESSHAITAPSAFLRDAAHAQLGIDPAHAIEVIPNCVDTAYFAPEPARDPHYFDALFGAAAKSCRPVPTLFHVSNFRAVKRAGDLIEVLARIRTRVPARLVLVGDGPQRAQLEAQAAWLGLRASVHFLGQLPRFREHLAQADAFLLTSESESFGLAALEALSCGVPVVGYAVGGLPSVVSEDVGVLVPALDRDALADRCAELLTQPERRARMATAARARALEHFRLEPTLERYERLFERLGPR
jgi:N-acetyl-alpha-D-glucosaminyl L-malate synthase BshA